MRLQTLVLSFLGLFLTASLGFAQTTQTPEEFVFLKVGQSCARVFRTPVIGVSVVSDSPTVAAVSYDGRGTVTIAGLSAGGAWVTITAQTIGPLGVSAPQKLRIFVTVFAVDKNGNYIFLDPKPRRPANLPKAPKTEKRTERKDR